MLRRKAQNRRSGAAATELALILPLVLVFFAGTIEITTTIFLRESLTIAAYEGARSGIQRRSTNQQVLSRIESVLESRGVTINGTIASAVRIEPDVALADTLEPIEVTVTAPIAPNTVLPFRWLNFFQSDTMSVNVIMRKEFRND